MLLERRLPPGTIRARQVGAKPRIADRPLPDMGQPIEAGRLRAAERHMNTRPAEGERVVELPARQIEQIAWPHRDLLGNPAFQTVAFGLRLVVEGGVLDRVVPAPLVDVPRFSPKTWSAKTSWRS